MRAGSAKKTVKAAPTKKAAAKRPAKADPRDDARKQLAAVSAVMKALADPAVDVERVADMIVKATLRLADAETAAFFRRDPDGWVLAAAVGVQAGNVGARATPVPGTIWGRAALSGQRFHYADSMFAEPKVAEPEKRRSRLAVPVVRHGESIGVLSMSRPDPGGFERSTIALIETFADQLAVAMENARLLKETTGGLERQTAQAEVLRAIAGSPRDVRPVLQAIAENAARFTGAKDVSVRLIKGDKLE